jgi:hypothetical protein
MENRRVHRLMQPQGASCRGYVGFVPVGTQAQAFRPTLNLLRSWLASEGVVSVDIFIAGTPLSLASQLLQGQVDSSSTRQANDRRQAAARGLFQA